MEAKIIVSGPDGGGRRGAPDKSVRVVGKGGDVLHSQPPDEIAALIGKYFSS